MGVRLGAGGFVGGGGGGEGGLGGGGGWGAGMGGGGEKEIEEKRIENYFDVCS